MQHPVKQDSFGAYLRSLREARGKDERPLSIRQLAAFCDVTPAYLSRVERGLVSPPGEALVLRLAKTLGEPRDVMLAMAGKVSSDLKATILKRPQLFAELIRILQDAPDHALKKAVRDVRDGDW